MGGLAGAGGRRGGRHGVGFRVAVADCSGGARHGERRSGGRRPQEREGGGARGDQCTLAGSEQSAHKPRQNIRTRGLVEAVRSYFGGAPAARAWPLGVQGPGSRSRGRGHIKNFSPSKDVSASRLNSVGYAVLQERDTLAVNELYGISVDDTVLSVQVFCQSAWLGDLITRHNDADNLFHLDLFAPYA